VYLQLKGKQPVLALVLVLVQCIVSSRSHQTFGKIINGCSALLGGECTLGGA
jgi:hypothetical protein